MEVKFTTAAVRPRSRYAKHRKSFKNRKYKTDTELSNEIWKLKEQNKNVGKILWQILGIHQSYNITTKRCMPYLNEKLATAIRKQDNVLNKRNYKQTIFERYYFNKIKVISKYRHSNKLNLTNYDTRD